MLELRHSTLAAIGTLRDVKDNDLSARNRITDNNCVTQGDSANIHAL